MKARAEFDEAYQRFSNGRDMYMSLKEITTGIPRWRLHIFERNAAKTGAGDMEILCVERPTEEECLKRATEALKEREQFEQKAKEKAF